MAAASARAQAEAELCARLEQQQSQFAARVAQLEGAARASAEALLASEAARALQAETHAAALSSLQSRLALTADALNSASVKLAVQLRLPACGSGPAPVAGLPSGSLTTLHESVQLAARERLEARDLRQAARAARARAREKLSDVLLMLGFSLEVPRAGSPLSRANSVASLRAHAVESESTGDDREEPAPERKHALVPRFQDSGGGPRLSSRAASFVRREALEKEKRRRGEPERSRSGASLASSGSDRGAGPATVGALCIDVVYERGCAEAAGVRAGDLLKALNGKPVPSVARLLGALETLAPGARIELTVVRHSSGPALESQARSADPAVLEDQQDGSLDSEFRRDDSAGVSRPFTPAVLGGEKGAAKETACTLTLTLGAGSKRFDLAKMKHRWRIKEICSSLCFNSTYLSVCECTALC